jgi:hypothetical protein
MSCNLATDIAEPQSGNGTPEPQTDHPLEPALAITRRAMLRKVQGNRYPALRLRLRHDFPVSCFFTVFIFSNQSMGLVGASFKQLIKMSEASASRFNSRLTRSIPRGSVTYAFPLAPKQSTSSVDEDFTESLLATR